MARNILVIHGPNLNLLGSREPDIYGRATLAELDQALAAAALASGAKLTALQSNDESVLIERVHAARGLGHDFIVINPAAFTHTSVALRDALAGVGLPFIEVHLSNTHRREAFRQHSFFSDLAVGVICGLGPHGYQAALSYALAHHG